ncbi:MAG TPA: tryptophan 7-halogenase [Chloroflexota bacterium]
MSDDRGAILNTDVAVVGGGPAGAAAAITIVGAGPRATLIEASRYDRQRIGETLPPSAWPLLAHLDGRLEQRVGANVAIPCHGVASAWSGKEIERRSFIFDAHGHGWHLDRRRFDSSLAGAAADLGVTVLEGQPVIHCELCRSGDWRLELRDGTVISSLAVIDATGRSARIGRLLGARRRVLDHLVGVFVRYRSNRPADAYLLIESEPNGWWYSAPLPGNEMIVVFMTDADLCRRYGWRDRRTWSLRLAATCHTSARVRGYEAESGPMILPAISQRLERGGTAGRWLAAGDAALAADPLSFSGITRALSMGKTAGRIMCHWLLGREQAVVDYEHWLDEQFVEYMRERHTNYSMVSQWPEAPFWKRRSDERA